jgi:signal transduction histidine kinase
MTRSVNPQNLWIEIGVSSLFFLLSLIIPWHYPAWQRLSYIGLGLALTIIGEFFGVNVGLSITIYIAKARLLFSRQITILIAVVAIGAWAIVNYHTESKRLQQAIRPNPMFVLDPHNNMPLLYVLGVILAFTAASAFAIMVSEMAISEQKNRQRAEELTQQIESLTATLERTRIAREIHDSLGHTLTNLDTQLAVAQTLRSHNPTQAFQAVDLAKLLSRQCIEDVSQALDRMRQSDFDLNQALITLLEQLRQASTLHVQWHVNLPHLPIYQSYQIYCIVKESLMNVQKHACASEVIFSADRTSRGIILDLKDNGVGYDLEASKPGFGLQGMMERIQLLGGQFDIQTAVDRGTQIHITLPL